MLSSQYWLSILSRKYPVTLSSLFCSVLFKPERNLLILFLSVNSLVSGNPASLEKPAPKTKTVLFFNSDEDTLFVFDYLFPKSERFFSQKLIVSVMSFNSHNFAFLCASFVRLYVSHVFYLRSFLIKKSNCKITLLNSLMNSNLMTI